MTDYFRPIAQIDPSRPKGALTLAGGWCWFDRVEKMTRGGDSQIIGVADLPALVRDRLTAPRDSLAGLDLNAAPRIMGILNVTPDSFSDGGVFNAPDAALARAREMVDEGADILDIGGESTRPGADTVAVRAETARTAPLIAAIRASGDKTPISLDTRKAAVGRTGLDAGADLINDVAAFTYDPALADVVAQARAPVCLMHAQGDPKTMQDAPSYEDVVLDVYDFLEKSIILAGEKGIPRARIVVDPGIGFGKTKAHNLALLNRISLFHALGCPILLGASRKRFIGEIAQAPDPAQRAPGSVAVALAAIYQGVQILRVHDIGDTWQALAMSTAIFKGN